VEVLPELRYVVLVFDEDFDSEDFFAEPFALLASPDAVVVDPNRTNAARQTTATVRSP
jgi:hypothetical protein